MLDVRPMHLSDWRLICEAMKERKGLNYDPYQMKFDRMVICYCFYWNEKLVCWSGIDYLEGRMRILTRATTLKGCPRPWGKTIEEKFFTNVMAGFSTRYSKYIEPTYDVVITTNTQSRISTLMHKSETDWMEFDQTSNIYGTQQDVWKVDTDRCENMTRKWCRKYGIDFGEENARIMY